MTETPGNEEPLRKTHPSPPYLFGMEWEFASMAYDETPE